MRKARLDLARPKPHAP